jgi:signal transduction histidine kinase
VLAHELRSPLAAIQSATEVLRQLAAGLPDLGRYVALIEHQVAHASRLAEDLLDADRVAAGKVRLRAERVDLAEVVMRAVEMCRPLLDARWHELTVSLPGAPAWLWGDATRLVQVVANLLNNAARYTEPGGRIALSVADVGVGVGLRVRDNGVGVAADALPHLFDPLARAGHSPGPRPGGLGVGLALVRSLVELHGGSVYAYSDGPGQGSEFVVYLPRRAEASARP